MKMRDLVHYMDKRNINSNIQMRVKRYLEYMFEEEKVGFQRGDQGLLKSLPKKLSEDVKTEVYGKILKDLHIFKKYFSQDFINKLSTKFKEVAFSPEEIIFSVNLFFFSKSIFFFYLSEK